MILIEFESDFLHFLETCGFHGAKNCPQSIERVTSELDHIRRYEIAKINPLDITFDMLVETRAAWEGELSKHGRPFSPATLNKRVNVLNNLIRYVYEKTNQRSLPPKMIRFSLAGLEPRGRALTIEEAQILLDVLAGSPSFQKYYPMVLIGLITGARFCELSALRWCDFSFDNMFFVFNQHQVKGNVRPGRKGNSKSTGYPLTRRLVNVLIAHRNAGFSEDEPEGLLFPARGDKETLKYKGFMQRGTLAKKLEKACRIANLPRITPHDLRRTLNTELIKRNIEPELIRQVTQHSGAEMTAYYSRLSASDKLDILAPLISSLLD